MTKEEIIEEAKNLGYNLTFTPISPSIGGGGIKVSIPDSKILDFMSETTLNGNITKADYLTWGWTGNNLYHKDVGNGYKGIDLKTSNTNDLHHLQNNTKDTSKSSYKLSKVNAYTSYLYWAQGYYDIYVYPFNSKSKYNLDSYRGEQPTYIRNADINYRPMFCYNI